MHFKIQNPDLKTSPNTGMNRNHWIESGKFLIDGVLGHVQSFDSPIILPKQHEVTYPKSDDPIWKFKAAEYEGLARTFMTAAPVINECPDWESHGYSVKDYYANQILSATDPNSPNYLWKVSELRREFGSQHYQHTVESAALVIGLMACRKQIWDQYSQSQKDQIADFINDYAHNRTLGHNWRYFNVMMLTFLKVNGYPIDEIALKDHLQHLMACYTGDGWYRDHLDFDFYIPWAFQFYGPLWCSWYGYEYEPDIAHIIEERHGEFMKIYPLFFSRKGHQLMWGRSIIYRCGASAAFGSAFLLKNTSVNPGWARRVASGNLLQFLSRDDVFYQDIPCLGFYGSFEPLVQFYSCAASPFWLSKIYTALNVPADSPFWTATENEGEWSNKTSGFNTTMLNGPGIHITNQQKSGASEVRPGKVLNEMPYYNRLSYNTDFLWEDNEPEGATAMTYSLKEYGDNKNFTVPLRLGFNRVESGVLYRQFNMGMGNDYSGPTRIDLADIIIENGVLRVDRLRIGVKHELFLGHYGMPFVNGITPSVQRFEVDGYQGISASIKGRQLALLAIHGWNDVNFMEHIGCNPEAEKSTIIYAKRTRETDYSGMELLITVLLHKTSDEPWLENDLNPIKSLEMTPWTKTNNPCGAKISFKDGRSFEIDFGNLEGDICF